MQIVRREENINSRYSSYDRRQIFYAGGDNVTGPNTVIETMTIGKKAAMNIDRKLMGKDMEGSLFKKYVCRNIIPIEHEGGERQYMKNYSQRAGKIISGKFHWAFQKKRRKLK